VLHQILYHCSDQIKEIEMDVYDLKLLQRQDSIKSSRAISHVR
jgi:hypothetical protein